MKKIILVFALSFITIIGSAQNAFGFKAGVNFASMTMEVPDDWDRELNPLISVSAIGQFELSYGVNLSLELGLAQRGDKIGYSQQGVEAMSKAYINQIVFSPGIAFEASDAFSFGFGPYLGYASTGKSKYTFSDGSIDESNEEDVNLDDDEKLDYGVNVNLNYLLNDVFLISGGYSLGLKDYNAHYDNSDLEALMNRGVMISFGYMFN